MSTLFDDLAILKHQDAGGICNRGQPMSDRENGPVREEPFRCFLDEHLSLGVKLGRRLVQNDEVRVP